MKKFLALILAVCLMFSFSGCMIGDNYYGKGYATIEEAWENNRTMDWEDESYDVGKEVERFNFVGGTKWVYISKGGYLVEVDLVYANDSWFVKSCSGANQSIADLAEWYSLADSDKDLCHILPGTNVLIGSRIHDGKTICVNGIEATTKTYTLSYEEAICVVDYWYIEDCKDYDYDSAVITYLEQSQNIA